MSVEGGKQRTLYTIAIVMNETTRTETHYVASVRFGLDAEPEEDIQAEAEARPEAQAEAPAEAEAEAATEAEAEKRQRPVTQPANPCASELSLQLDSWPDSRVARIAGSLTASQGANQPASYPSI